MSPQRWQRRPDGSNWGDFGEDDQLGRLNLLTAEKTRRAALEIKEGLSFCLSLPLDYPGGRVLSRFRQAPALSTVGPENSPQFNHISEPGRSVDIECDDAVTLALQYSTHWDSLAHIGQLFDADGSGELKPTYYNGFRAGEHVVQHDGNEGGGKGALKLGIETVAETCVQGRGVMIDLHHHVSGQGPHSIGFLQLEQILRADGIVVQDGDIVCFHTGFSDLLLSAAKKPDPIEIAARTIALDGRDARLLDWISHSGLAAIVADNFAVKSYPAAPDVKTPSVALPLHEHCLFKLGIPLGELWNLGDLARWLRKSGRTRFFLTAPPLRLPGAIGSPVTPVATV